MHRGNFEGEKGGKSRKFNKKYEGGTAGEVRSGQWACWALRSRTQGRLFVVVEPSTYGHDEKKKEERIEF